MPSLDQLRRAGRAANKNFYDPTIAPQYPPDLLLEPVHLSIDLFFDIANEEASGRVTTTVEARGNQVRVLVLDATAFEDVTVKDVDGLELDWHYDGEKLAIKWVDPFQEGEQRLVEVAYRVVKPVDGIVFSKPDDAYPGQAWYAASDHETERARYWLPCIDHPNVRTTLDIRLRAESRFTILANGVLESETVHEDGTKTAHWRLEQLCPSYLICVAIGDFVAFDDGVFDDGRQRVDLTYFCTPDHTADDLRRTFAPTRAMMTWITEKLAMPFPYPKYYQFTVPGILGAMENISLTSWNDRVMQDEVLALEAAFRTDETNIHEMAHSYFGDAIVCRDFAHTWLKESWAVYMVQCYLEDTATREERDYIYFGDARRYLHEADNRYKRPIVTRRFRSSFEIFDSHTYPGGACRLHTLRKEIGDDVFWTAVRDYLRRYKGKVVETDHFRQVMEEHSGRSLGQFFDQWFYTAGYPDLHVSFSYDEKKHLGSFEVEQEQVDAENNIPPFILNTELWWMIDGKAYILPVKLEREKQVFVANMASAPDQVRFDPHGKVLHKLTFNPGGPLLRKQLTDAPDVIGRILAAQELVKTGKHGDIQAVVEAYFEEPFWGVRREMATLLAGANHETAVAGLARLISFEQDPMVMSALFRVAGSYRDGRILAALRQRLEGELPYNARAAALESVGKQRQAAPIDLLLETSGQEGFNGIVQSGALHALGATRRNEALDPLLAAVRYGALPIRARTAAVMALSDIGKGQERGRREQIIETLIDLLRDPWYAVHTSAAQGLGTMSAVEAIPALEAYANRLGFHDRLTVGKMIDSLRGQEKVDGSALTKQVEDLQEKIRKLEDRVENLAAEANRSTAESGENI